jgi:hypothetical protein
VTTSALFLKATLATPLVASTLEVAVAATRFNGCSSRADNNLK